MENCKRGDFKWKNGIEDSEVVFVENKNGRFLIASDSIDEFDSKLIFE